jgi:hypothetical protein
MSENGEHTSVRRRYNDTHDAEFCHMLSGATGARSALRRTLLCRSLIHAHLLSTGLYSEAAQIGELPLLSERRRGGSSRLPALSALPS